jgi:hypothetical protein
MHNLIRDNKLLAAFLMFVIFGFTLAQAQNRPGIMTLTSPDFTNNKLMPERFTCQGENVNPALVVSNIPEAAESLVLIVDDPDAPGKTWVHWVVFNIRPQAKIEEDSNPGVQGINDFRQTNYGGPCPPSGTHRYFFKIYALNKKLSLPPGASKVEVEQAMRGHIIALARLVGLYQKR